MPRRCSIIDDCKFLLTINSIFSEHEYNDIAQKLASSIYTVFTYSLDSFSAEQFSDFSDSDPNAYEDTHLRKTVHIEKIDSKSIDERKNVKENKHEQRSKHYNNNVSIGILLVTNVAK